MNLGNLIKTFHVFSEQENSKKKPKGSRSKKQKVDNVPGVAWSAFTKACDSFQPEINPSSQDPDLAFGQFVGLKLKEMSEARKNQVMMEFMAILTRREAPGEDSLDVFSAEPASKKSRAEPLLPPTLVGNVARSVQRSQDQSLSSMTKQPTMDQPFQTKPAPISVPGPSTLQRPSLQVLPVKPPEQSSKAQVLPTRPQVFLQPSTSSGPKVQGLLQMVT